MKYFISLFLFLVVVPVQADTYQCRDSLITNMPTLGNDCVNMTTKQSYDSEQIRKSPAVVQPQEQEPPEKKIQQPTTGIPIEDPSMLSILDESHATELAIMVILAGFRCDSISSARPFLYEVKYSISCNSFRYKYDIEDKGGRWIVTVK